MNTNTIRSPLAWPSIQTSSQTSGKNGSETFAATMRTAFFYSSRIVLADAPALAKGAALQHRVTKLSPRPAGEDDLVRLFEQSLRLW